MQQSTILPTEALTSRFISRNKQRDRTIATTTGSNPQSMTRHTARLLARQSSIQLTSSGFTADSSRKKQHPLTQSALAALRNKHPNRYPVNAS